MKERVLDKMNLYFIALVPDRELSLTIREMKEDMKARFDVTHALKSPAHITLQMPFRRFKEEEQQIAETLSLFASGEKPFRIDLNGFGYFPKGVIFIKIEDHVPVAGIHGRLKKVLTEQLGFVKAEIMTEVHPHITLATRDLTPATLKEAWPEFENRKFSASFEVHSISLLKHNGKRWDIFNEYSFSQNE
jgi:2'-5' RNA ligase